MGAVAGVLFFIALLVIGLFGISAGIVGIILFNLARKKGKKFGKPLIAVSAVVLAFSLLLTAVPIGFFTFIIKANSEPPEDFVETAIVIEEDGYQEERFTADGVVYEVLGEHFYAYNDDYLSEPIFSYKKSGFMNGSQSGNYYKVENENEFNIVTDGNFLFCPVSEKQEVIEYYNDNDNFDWWYSNLDSEVKFDEEAQKAIDELYEIYNGNPETVTITLDLDDEDGFYADMVTKDNSVSKDCLYFFEYNGKLYMDFPSQETNDEMMEYEADSFTDEDYFIEYEAFEIPNDLAEVILSAIR